MSIDLREKTRYIVEWDQFKNYITGVSSSLSYTWSQKNNTSILVITEPLNGISYETEIPLSASGDISDFNSNFRDIPIKKDGQWTQNYSIPIDVNGSVIYGIRNTEISSSQPGFVFLAPDTEGILRTPVVSANGSTIVSGTVQLEDGSGSGRKATVDESLRLRVAIAPPQPPALTTPVVVQEQGNVGGTPIDNFYIIPNGQTLFIQSFTGGGAGGGDSSVVELFYDPNANLTGMTLIRAGYVSGNNFQFLLNTESTNFQGNGTRRIVLRRRRLDGGNREIAGFWEGYLQ